MSTPPLPQFSFPDLAGRVIVLTGAANGIGRVLAQGLAVQGCRLYLLDRDAGRLEELAAELNSGAPAEVATPLACDLSDTAARARASATIAADSPVVDGLIHNAAIDPRLPMEETSLEFFRQIMATNVEPAVEMTRDLLPCLRRSTAPRIVLMGSVTMELGTALLSSYVASKGAIVELTRSLAHELGPDGITVNCIAPGAIDVEKVLAKRRAAGLAEHESTVVQFQSVKRPLVPKDLLGPTCLLLSEAGGAITGQVITVDGGLVHPIASGVYQSGHNKKGK